MEEEKPGGSNAWTSADCEINRWMEGKQMFMVDQTLKSSHGAYFGKFTGLACFEIKETSLWPGEHALW